ncbi:hypothetical protein HMPREF3152_05050 [Actinomyces sp. HMSC06A08]|uniref:Uncharacterized protein n=1 Tax=Winkia neuii TaxID=33007 RepID=A0A2I1IP63_9ACTO|nr:hypothetical protein HMPREF3198_01306 [Winkia neuii]OFT55442.1 hypothetical protein HMPREF3152_05050 [Actinomyces sp. HMSC06A08]PKY72914.1 hypothetical protein CYJ19_04575 [Winkia neuii]
MQHPAYHFDFQVVQDHLAEPVYDQCPPVRLSGLQNKRDVGVSSCVQQHRLPCVGNHYSIRPQHRVHGHDLYERALAQSN